MLCGNWHWPELFPVHEAGATVQCSNETAEQLSVFHSVWGWPNTFHLKEVSSTKSNPRRKASYRYEEPRGGGFSIKRSWCFQEELQPVFAVTNSERGSVWRLSPRLYFIGVVSHTTCSKLEGDGRRVMMCPPHFNLWFQLCCAAIGIGQNYFLSMRQE